MTEPERPPVVEWHGTDEFETPALAAALADDGASDQDCLRLLQAVLRRPLPPKVRRLVFFDVEATGLSRNASTLVFLLGMATYDGRRLETRQILLAEPCFETGLLTAFLEAATADSLLVSYNGKSYDLSVLRTRMVLNRLLSPLESELKCLPHLDLLHAGRALWKGLLPDHRLCTLERELLGLRRQNDLDGALVPAAWYGWLEGRSPVLERELLEHNRQDVQSMVGLAERLLAQLLSPDRRDDSLLCFNRGRILVRAGLFEAARQELERALAGGLPEGQSKLAGRLLARLCRYWS